MKRKVFSLIISLAVFIFCGFLVCSNNASAWSVPSGTLNCNYWYGSYSYSNVWDEGLGRYVENEVFPSPNECYTPAPEDGSVENVRIGADGADSRQTWSALSSEAKSGYGNKDRFVKAKVDKFLELMERSDGRNHIASVNWAAGVTAAWLGGSHATESNCAIWIGPRNDSVNVGISVRYSGTLSRSVEIGIYGMCTNGGNTAVNVRTKNIDTLADWSGLIFPDSGGSRAENDINSQNSGSSDRCSGSGCGSGGARVSRGGWGSPGTGFAAWLDLYSLLGMNESNGYTSSEYEELLRTGRYSTVIGLWRCHNGGSLASNGSCGIQKIPIELRLERVSEYSGQTVIYDGTELAGQTGKVATDDSMTEPYGKDASGGTREYIVKTVQVSLGDTKEFTFNHDVYAEGVSSGTQIAWKFKQMWCYAERGLGSCMDSWSPHYMNSFTTGNADYYTVVDGSGLSSYNGDQVRFDSAVKEGNTFLGIPVGHTRVADNKAIVSDKIKIKFDKTGEYLFCENLNILNKSVDLTHLCVKVKVLGGDAYYGRSTVAIQNGAAASVLASKDTGVIVTANEGVSYTVTAGESVNVVFTHNLYSDEWHGITDAVTCPDDGSDSDCEPRDAVDDKKTWSVAKGGSNNGIFGSASVSGSGASDSNVYFTAMDASVGKYLGNPSPNNDDGTVLLREDIYSATFTTEGDYQICETIKLDGASVDITVCANIRVNRSTALCKDGIWATTYNNYLSSTVWSGRTYVKNGVMNVRLDEWKDTGVYARPDDKTQWLDCYYPGVQKTAGTNVTYWHRDTCSCGSGESERHYPASNSYWDYKTGGWQNRVTITADGTNSTSSASVFRNFNPLSTLPGMDMAPAPASKIFGVSDVMVTLAIGNSNIWYNGREYNHGNSVARMLAETGMTFSERMESGGPTAVSISSTYHSGSRCCRSCRRGGCCGTCYWAHNYNQFAGVTKSSVSDNSLATIPYNFENTGDDTKVEVNIAAGDPVYSGETIGVTRATVKVGVKENSATESTYATLVRDASVSLVAYVVAEDNLRDSSRQVSGSAGSDVCSLIDEHKSRCATVNSETGTVLNRNSELDTGFLDGDGAPNSAFNFKGTYNVFDASAGDYFCMAIAVYPATSGADTSTDVNGDGNWHISAPVCRIIAKRPSFEVLGGGLYTSGNIAVWYAQKNNLWNVTSYQAQGGGNNYFTSWVDQGAIANGSVTNLPSGAALRTATNATSYVTSWRYCTQLVPLSFANYANPAISGLCAGGDSGVTGHANFRSGTINQQALVNYWGDVENGDSSSISIGSDDGFVQVSSATGEDVKMYKYGGDITLSGGTVWKNQTRIVRVDGNVKITDNIIYERGGYSEIAEVPKVIIYASGNINIDCKVNEIDAILIAGETIDTCSDTEQGGDGPWSSTSQFVNSTINSTEPNQSYLSNQLTINGMVIAKTLNLKRTYGGGYGEHSTEAAEIINYDSSALLWGRMMSGSSESDTMTLVYQHELSPRY